MAWAGTSQSSISLWDTSLGSATFAEGLRNAIVAAGRNSGAFWNPWSGAPNLTINSTGSYIAYKSQGWWFHETNSSWGGNSTGSLAAVSWHPVTAGIRYCIGESTTGSTVFWTPTQSGYAAWASGQGGLYYCQAGGGFFLTDATGSHTSANGQILSESYSDAVTNLGSPTDSGVRGIQTQSGEVYVWFHPASLRTGTPPSGFNVDQTATYTNQSVTTSCSTNCTSSPSTTTIANDFRNQLTGPSDTCNGAPCSWGSGDADQTDAWYRQQTIDDVLAGASTTPLVAPVDVAAPLISGVMDEGQTLMATEGNWDGSPKTFAYQWQRCLGGSCADISGATSSSYVLTADDVNTETDVKVSAINVTGTTTATSEPVGGACSYASSHCYAIDKWDAYAYPGTYDGAIADIEATRLDPNPASPRHTTTAELWMIDDDVATPPTGWVEVGWHNGARDDNSDITGLQTFWAELCVGAATGEYAEHYSNMIIPSYGTSYAFKISYSGNYSYGVYVDGTNVATSGACHNTVPGRWETGSEATTGGVFVTAESTGLQKRDQDGSWSYGWPNANGEVLPTTGSPFAVNSSDYSSGFSYTAN